MEGSSIVSLFRRALLFMSLMGTFGTAFGSGHVTLAWDASNDPLVAGYRVYYGLKSGLYSSVVEVTNQISLTIGHLDEGSTWYFALASFYSDGTESDFTPEISYLVPWSTPAGSNWVAGLNATFSGLISEETVQPQTAGSLTLSIGPRAACSGHLRLGGQKYPFAGRLDADGTLAKTLRLGGQSLSLHLQIGTGDERGRLTGELDGGSWHAQIAGATRVFDATTNPSPCGGRFAIAISPDQSARQSPAGYGYGLVRVSAGGQIWFSGALADGTKITQASVLCVGAIWPVYVPLYRSGGVLMNWLTFAPQTNSPLSGSLTWIRPAIRRARFYPDGFTTVSPIIASAYHMPNSPATALLQPARVTAAFSGGNLVASLADPVQLDAFGAVEDLSSAGISMRFVRSTGIFHGQLKDAATGAYWPFDGVVLQNANTAFGMLRGPDQTSRVIIGE
jgi:hypothetical protein